MTRVLLSSVAVLLLCLVAACGGDDSGTSTTRTSTATPRTTDRPTASLNPKSGPPGIDVTATGTGWPAGVEVAITGGSAGSQPYTTAITDDRGSFSAKFFLEKKPDGSALETGRFDIIASSGSTVVTVPYVVEVRRPTGGGAGPGGG